MSHTPGPWNVEEFRKGSYLVTARNAGTAREGIVAQHVPGIANARLIAAAPELYQVCWELEKLPPNSYAAEKARKVIAKLQREGGEKSE